MGLWSIHILRFYVQMRRPIVMEFGTKVPDTEKKLLMFNNILCQKYLHLTFLLNMVAI